MATLQIENKHCLGCGELLKLQKSDIGRPSRYVNKRYCGPTCKTTNPLIKKNVRLYHIWKGMIHRCDKIYATSYPRYGAKGIGVCTRWYKFEDFVKDMLSTYKDDLTIDRIDSAGDYKPSNCKWSTYKEQRLNQANVHKFDGKNLLELAEENGFSRRLLYDRLVVNKWTLDRALNTPVRTY